MKQEIAEFATQITLAAIEKGLPETRDLEGVCKFYKTIHECLSECNKTEPGKQGRF